MLTFLVIVGVVLLVGLVIAFLRSQGSSSESYTYTAPTYTPPSSDESSKSVWHYAASSAPATPVARTSPVRKTTSSYSSSYSSPSSSSSSSYSSSSSSSSSSYDSGSSWSSGSSSYDSGSSGFGGGDSGGGGASSDW